MGLFGNPNKDVEKVIKKLERSGLTRDAYKSRPNCGTCKFYSGSMGFCNYQKKKTVPAEYCPNFWAR